ncbi:CRISPR-associated protein Cas4 [Magnetospirillum sp. SS-4]|uniref:CRISPR-associated protein Cas4 n=1 Tax=Magnetospirillum sp. SS-4 TaxID=2681465 RepID=UPI00137E2588|nr:CRISPR-associated protein Cas4 [Magnetospirillum sp. SS-4]CAA7616880.1 RecB family exonuclease N [Magnetospirillum sp. SS-4]
MEDDDDLIPLSALQHWLACPRQCALIHLEQVWIDNQATAEGNLLHARVDHGGAETRGTMRKAWALPLRSTRLGLVGKADLVEFHAAPDGGEIPYPVEHKRGREKADDRDRVQLCAQGLCLEEMLGVAVPEGALFYYASRRRVPVAFDDGLRRRTEAAARSVGAMLASGRTPPPVECSACKGCSLAPTCLPETLSRRHPSQEQYFRERP